MADTNTNSCCCEYDRDEIELQEQAMPRIVLVDEDDCCSCDEIELYTDRDPDIVLFDEYAEEYIDDIVAARVAAEEARDAVNTKSATIISKENEILSDVATVEGDLTQGVADIRSDISTQSTDIKSKIANALLSILSAITNGVSAIRGDISQILFNELEECSEDDIDAMFEDEE